MTSTNALITREQAGKVMRELGIQTRLLGYRYLCIAIPRFAVGDIQSMSKELYPYVAEQADCADSRAVEHAIRYVITEAWAHRDTEEWGHYFPRQEKSPSNKEFIATLAQCR